MNTVPTSKKKRLWTISKGTVDVFVLTSLDQLLLILKTLFAFLQNELP
jgi:hypothetical protein